MRRLFALCLALWASAAAAAPSALTLKAVWLQRQPEPVPTLSGLDPRPDDLGLAGARLGEADNDSAGRFLNQTQELIKISVPPDGDFLKAAREALAASPLVAVSAPAADLLALADLPEAKGALILNAGAMDDDLRGADCRANVLHIAPSRAMLADALAQGLMRRGWKRWRLMEGRKPEDLAFGAAIRASARKFGAKIVAETPWTADADLRRNAAEEIPALTQGPDYDVMIVADEADDFARYVPYNTYHPRPVAGSEGLRPTVWAPVMEQWGGAQLNNRFKDLAKRPMTAEDFSAWAALRALAEAATRANTVDPAALRAYMLSPRFSLGVFKGRAAGFRDWDGQMRQPVSLVHVRASVETAPVEGYLHQRTELDTLGTDKPESACRAFGGK